MSIEYFVANFIENLKMSSIVSKRLTHWWHYADPYQIADNRPRVPRCHGFTVEAKTAIDHHSGDEKRREEREGNPNETDIVGDCGGAKERGVSITMVEDSLI